MARFEVYSKIVEINGDEYSLKPLNGDLLAVVYRIVKGINPTGKAVKEEELLNNMSDIIIKDIHLVCMATLKQSYPDVTDADMAQFVTANLWKIFPVVMQLNTENEV